MQADIRDLIYDLKAIRANLSQFKIDADRGINVNHMGVAEGEPKAKTIERLFHYLIDAKHDMDRVGDSLYEIQERLDDLLAWAEYEEIAGKVR
jgi:hypothetical protein